MMRTIDESGKSKMGVGRRLPGVTKKTPADAVLNTFFEPCDEVGA